MCRPADSRSVFDDISDEFVLLIAKMHPILYAAPVNVEGNICLYRRTPLQGVHNIVKVPDLFIAESHRGSRITEVNLYVLIRGAYRPKQAARSDTGVEVVGLIRRGNLPLIEVQSYQGEGARVLFPIHANINTLHEAYIDIEEEGVPVSGASICSCPGTLEVRKANGAMEISNGR